MLPVPDFDQLHVISDLHMGGRSGSQIFSSGKTLAAFIDSLTDGEAKKEIALCINGDFVDFLAEPGACYFDPQGAAAKLDAIAADASFIEVWVALRRFVAKLRRHLILVLGNHDLELALPWVQNHLLDLLAQGDGAARSRIVCSFEGEGFLARVGGASVLCLHGNELDPFNLTDHERIRRIGRDLTYGRTIESWTPNAGTKLVIDVMNGIKEKYAFVDVLKPEPAVVALLWALDQATAPRLAKVLEVAARLSWDVVRRAAGFLSAKDLAAAQAVTVEAQSPASGPDLLSVMLADTFQGATSKVSTSLVDRLLDETEHDFNSNIEPLALLMDHRYDQLGLPSAIWSWVVGEPRHKQIWQALRRLAVDTSFDQTDYDEAAERADALIGAEIPFIVAGHTHKARSLKRRTGSGHYFNSGTWAGLMRLAPAQLKSERSFKSVFDRLEQSHRLPDLGELVLSRPTVVSFHAVGGDVANGLRLVSLRGTKLRLEELPRQ